MPPQCSPCWSPHRSQPLRSQLARCSLQSGGKLQAKRCLCRTQLPLISLPAFPKERVSFHHSTRHELCHPVPVIPKRSQLCNCADTSNFSCFFPGLCVFTHRHTPFSGQASEPPAACCPWPSSTRLLGVVSIPTGSPVV